MGLDSGSLLAMELLGCSRARVALLAFSFLSSGKGSLEVYVDDVLLHVVFKVD